MKVLIAAAGASILLSAAGFAVAQPHPQSKPSNDRPAAAARPEPSKGKGPAAQERYGEWKSGWGSRPPAPPKHWTKTSDWHRHVRACQQRYKSYDARTDSYQVRPGLKKRCTL